MTNESQLSKIVYKPNPKSKQVHFPPISLSLNCGIKECEKSI